jgi:putative hydrolase of the HAD superfamily
MSVFLATDADNTLWDTNRLFADAQLALLERIETTIGQHYLGDDRLHFVRRIDQDLAESHKGDLRYPPGLLARAIGYALSGVEIAHAVQRSIQDHNVKSPQIDEHAAWFASIVAARSPELRLGVREGLMAIADRGILPLIITETSAARCEALVTYHGLAGYFSGIVSDRKDPTLYARVARTYGRGAQYLLMVGDQLDRDVGYASVSGYITVHFPGGFEPSWIAQSAATPNFVISAFSELGDILDRFDADGEHGVRSGGTASRKSGSQ